MMVKSKELKNKAKEIYTPVDGGSYDIKIKLKAPEGSKVFQIDKAEVPDKEEKEPGTMGRFLKKLGV